MNVNYVSKFRMSLLALEAISWLGQIHLIFCYPSPSVLLFFYSSARSIIPQKREEIWCCVARSSYIKYCLTYICYIAIRPVFLIFYLNVHIWTLVIDISFVLLLRMRRIGKFASYLLSFIVQTNSWHSAESNWTWFWKI